MGTCIKNGRLVGCLAVLLLEACTVGPDYVRPNVVVSTKFKEAKGKEVVAPHKNWKPIAPKDDCKRGDWWTVFKDPLLNSLEDELNQYNQNIVVAVANYKQSLAFIDQARASYYPLLTGTLNLIRQKSGGGSTPVLGVSSGAEAASTGIVNSGLPTTTTYSSALNASWEPDIWGLVQRTVESNVATAQSNAALVAVTKLSQQGSLAQLYFELRTLDSAQKLLDDTVKSYKEILKLTKNQYASGVASQADILSARALLESAEAQALNNGIARGQFEHAIAILIGRPPALLSLKAKPLNALVPNIPVTVPTVWLERRPDIAQAERLVQTASANIGVAIAAFYPTLTLSGSVSAAGRTLNELFHTPAVGWATGLQLAQTIFDGGLRSATVRAQIAAYHAQVATYRQTVLTAFQDVEDNLIALRILKEQVVVQNKAAKTAKEALQLVMNQYKAGTVTYINVMNAQIAAFSAQKTANDVAGLEMSATVGLIKALGGGWERADLA